MNTQAAAAAISEEPLSLASPLTPPSGTNTILMHWGSGGGGGRGSSQQKDEAVKIKIAKMFLYSSHTYSIRSLTDEKFLDVITAAGGGSWEAPRMTSYFIRQYLDAEFLRFEDILRVELRAKMEEALGNRFLQVILDGGTAKNRMKHLAVGIQLIGAKWSGNKVYCIGFVRVQDCTNAATAAALEKLFHDRLGVDIRSVCMMLVLDRGAIGVGDILGLPERACLMHDSDKVGSSATGKLTRSKNKVKAPTIRFALPS